MGISADSIPRYAEPTLDELKGTGEDGPTCRDCVYCKEVEKTFNGLTEYLSACVFEVYHASTWEELTDASIDYVEPTDAACRDFKEDR